MSSSVSTSRIRLKAGKYEELENNLYNSTVAMRGRKKIFLDYLIIGKATIINKSVEITDFNTYKRWFRNCKSRFSFKNTKLHGEVTSADTKSVFEGESKFSLIVSR